MIPWMVLVIVGLALAFLIFFSQLRYRVTSRHLQICFGGMPIRRICLQDIRYISIRRSRLAENWLNTFRTHRLLVIHRRHGLIKDIAITPRRRYEFKVKIERAMSALPPPTTDPDTLPPQLMV